MKLNKKKEVQLYKKALYVKKLEYYTKLCEIYRDLAQTQNGKRPAEIEQRYSRALTLATKGNIDFLEEPDCIFNGNESSLIRDYAFATDIYFQFTQASDMFNEAFPEGENYVDLEKEEEYYDFMQNTSKSTRVFEEFTSQHSLEYIGREYFKRYENSLSTIQSIDPKHIPYALSKLAPQSFCAEITGCRTTFRRLQKDGNILFTDKEIDKYATSAPTLKEKVKETLYSAQTTTSKALSKTSEIYHDHKHQLKSAALGVMAAAGAFTAFNWMYDSYIKNHQFATTNKEQGYEDSYSNELIQSIALLQKRTNSSNISLEELAEIRILALNVLNRIDTENATKYCEQNGYEFLDQSTYYIPEVELFPYSQVITFSKDGVEDSVSTHYLSKPEDLREKLNSDDLSLTMISDIVDDIDNLAGNNVKYSRLLGAYTVPAEKSREVDLTFANNSNTVNTIDNDNGRF